MFVHLHTHSDFSPQDGAQSVAQIAERAKELEMEYVALTDHGRAGGLLQFNKACIKNDVKPIFGVELYLAPESRFTKEKLDHHTKTSYHLTVLAKNKTGLQNLFALTSIGWLEGFYYKPRIDMDILREKKEGLVVLSGCASGYASVMSAEEKYAEALQFLAQMEIIFDDDFYVEIQNHGIQWQPILNNCLKTYANKLSLPTVVTQDSHYPTQDKAILHNYICKLAAGDLEFDSDQSWFKSYDEIKEMFDEEDYDAIHRTVDIARKCSFDWEYGQTIWPVYELEADKTPEQELRDKAKDGFNRLFGTGNQEYRDRLEYELKIIEQMGFPTYFLVVADFINWAKNNNIAVGPGRGSGAGSLVCYCIGITEVDPIKYGLYFERFLNPARVSLPDIDVDFCKKNRTKVMEYVARRYGTEKVAQIGTYSTFKPRGALRSFARVTGHEPSVGHQLAALVPPDIAGKGSKFKEILETVPEISKTEWPEVVELAIQSEGLRTQAGVHAAGVVISDDTLNKTVPLFRGKHEEAATQFDMHDVEEIGLVKYDFLGLRNLTVIEETRELVKEIHGVDINFENIPDGDEKTYNNIFCRGDLTGVFQFETSSGFQELCIQVQPKCIEDLAVITSLFRPGPLETKLTQQYVEGRGGAEVTYLIPQLEPILKDTYGVMTYQEQIMKICTDVAGYTLPEADNMRKIIGKKLPEKMKLERGKFIEGCVQNGVSEVAATKLFDDIEGFAAYSFNKAHAVAYSIISYRTAWLKAHYPNEFYTSLLNSSEKDQTVKYIHSAREAGIPIYPPDVNRSGNRFTLDNGTIIFGFSGIKGIGEKGCEDLINKRQEKEFTCLEDLVEAKIKKDVIGALAECGALEELCSISRSQIVEKIPELIEYSKKKLKWDEGIAKRKENNRAIEEAVAAGKKPPRRLPKMRGTEPMPPELGEPEQLSRKDRLQLERKTLGFYLTGHPLDDYPGLEKLSKMTLSDLKMSGCDEEKSLVHLPIVVSSIVEKRSKKKQNYAIIEVEDKTGRLEGTVFSKKWEKLKGNIEEGKVSILTGWINRIHQDDDKPIIVKLSIKDIRPIDKDILARPEELSLTIKSGAMFKFIPNSDDDPTRWQRAHAYVNNIQKG